MAIVVVEGYSPSNKVPGFHGTTNFAQGRSGARLFRRTVLLVGLMGSTGATASVNTLYDIYKDTDADKFGRRGELARMCRAAGRVPGAKIKAMAVTAGTDPVAATAAITVGGSWSTTGVFKYRIGGTLISGSIAATDSTTQAAVKIRDAFLANADIPVVASASSAVVTLTCNTPGVRGNQYMLAQDTSELPSGATSTLAGGTAVTGGITPLSSGSVLETYTSLLAVVATAQYDRIGLACNDATSLAAWKTHLTTVAGSLVGHLEAAAFATNGVLAAAQSLSQSTLNEPRMNNLWSLYQETHPSEIAAEWAARRAVTEEANPSPRYMNIPLACATPQQERADWPIETVRDAALNAGVTPLMTTEDSRVVVNRGITTYCKLGSAQDERCLDINQQSMPDYARERYATIWNTEIAPEYPYVKDNPGENDPDPPAGTITPDLWDATLLGENKTWEREGWVIDVDDNKPESIYDATSRRLMTEAPCVPSPLNYAVGVNVRQRAV